MFTNEFDSNSVLDRVIPGSIHAPGVFKNYNTIEEFKAADKTALFNQVADEVCYFDIVKASRRD